MMHGTTGSSAYAAQVILKQLDLIEDQTTVKTLHKKMAPPLVTLLSAESEIQYVALRNINLIVQKNPGILAHEVKVSCYPAVLCKCCQTMPALPCHDSVVQLHLCAMLKDHS